mmetsp:Transcript_153361/g.282618  ORF Transcript_153361/g.282618 Transcript_153361/m.282618 type:complete len:234 (+) Transcript_153361:3-704(+)
MIEQLRKCAAQVGSVCGRATAICELHAMAVQWQTSTYKARRAMIEHNRYIASDSGVLDPNGGLEGTLKRRGLENDDRKWAKKVRYWEKEKEEAARKEEEEAAKRAREAEAATKATAAAERTFQPTAAAMLDPKAYFAQFQQFQMQAAGASGSRQPLRQHSAASSGVSAKAQPANSAVSGMAQGVQVPGLQPNGLLRPMVAAPPKRFQAEPKEDVRKVTGLGLVGGYDSGEESE